MNYEQPAGPEVIRFTGVWAGLLGMHQYCADKELSLSFESVEDNRKRRILWEHNTKKSECYLFVAINPLSVIEGYRVYDLEVDDSEKFARLYVTTVIGEAAVKTTAEVEEDEVENGWQEDQRHLGLVLPNPEEKHNFQRIFFAFYDAITSHNQATHKSK